jgi:hypothetical protein
MRQLAVPFSVPPPPAQYLNQKGVAAGSSSHSPAWPLLHSSLNDCLKSVGSVTCDALVQAFLGTGNVGFCSHTFVSWTLSLSLSSSHYHHHYHHLQHVYLLHHLDHHHHLTQEICCLYFTPTPMLWTPRF